MLKKIKNVFIFITLLIASIIIVGAIYYSMEYPNQDFDQIIFYLLNGIEYTSPSVINAVIFKCIIPVGLLCIFLYILTISKTKKQMYITIQIRSREFKIPIYPIKIIAKHKKIYILVILLLMFVIATFGFKINKYIKNIINETNIYDEFYYDARDVEITFPEEKRNLIIIIAESMENSVMSKENGGAWEYSIIPELEKIALENTNFSHTEGLGGMNQMYGADYTAGGMVAITAGIPLKTIEFLTDKNIYNGNGRYLEGAYTLGEILREQGYNLEIMMGSEGTFGGREQYFKTNGNYKIFDLNYAIEQGKMDASDYVWWGFEDDKLFEWSKEEITALAAEDKPFNYIMLTADTHFIDGYLSPNAEQKFSKQYENVYAHSSKSINEFVEWIQQQDFYENTTIVILGDHLGMQTDFYTEGEKSNYYRTIYNVIINPAIEKANNTNRTFTAADMYPTMLASIGVEIEGNKIGLGTNLYSGIPTLAEEFGILSLNEELAKSSRFYNKMILGDDYYVMKENTQKESEASDEENINNNTSI